ncbi:MAG: ATP synthase F0 subunit C, partial [Candidatus Omnitrophica bacterium]|nr:ATP synthase F0 subunit C [Candidatus Omnitrophota bacterium]
MDFKSALDLGIPLALGVAAFGSAIGLGWAVSSALGGVSRQPE